MTLCAGMALFSDAAVLELHLLQFGLIVNFFPPTLKSVVQMFFYWLPCKAKISLEQFCVDLIQSLCFIGCFIQRLICPGKYACMSLLYVL